MSDPDYNPAYTQDYDPELYPDPFWAVSEQPDPDVDSSDEKPGDDS